jgi:hypothetical protein
MKKTFSSLNRKKLKKMLSEVFNEQLHSLQPELQSLLIDDMITAFHNRLSVFRKIESEKN